MIKIGVLRIGAVIGHAGQRAVLVAKMADTEPLVAGPKMIAHGEAKSLLERRLAEQADDVFFWAHVHGVPAGVLRVPEIEIVVVHAHAHEVFCAGFFIKVHKKVGIELVGLPGGDDVFESEFRRMPVVLDVILVLPLALDIHVSRVPVAAFSGRLRSPMGPDAELGVAEPVRNFIRFKRFAGSLEGAGHDCRQGFSAIRRKR